VRSYEEYRAGFGEGRDYDRHQITQFIRMPFFNNDTDMLLDGGEKPVGKQRKVSYNDTGSFEEVDEEKVELLAKTFEENKRQQSLSMESEMDSSISNNYGRRSIMQNYHDLWNLRATLEEEEEQYGGLIHVEDVSSPENPPLAEDQTMAVKLLAPWAGQALNPSRRLPERPPPPHCPPESSQTSPTGMNLLYPDSQNRRRQTYRNTITQRMQQLASQNCPVEKITAGCTPSSFDSVETVETDGDVSDTSRHDVTTTSFESTTTTTTTTTENTDSTGDGPTAARVSQLRVDSGYKSIELQQSLLRSTSDKHHSKPCGPPIISPSPHPPVTSISRTDCLPGTTAPPPPENFMTDVSLADDSSQLRHDKSKATQNYSFSRASTTLERRCPKTAAKKRREFRKESHLAYDSMSEPGTGDIENSDQQSGKSLDEISQGSLGSRLSAGPTTLPRFLRYHLRSSGWGNRGGGGRDIRDYSVDETSDALFNEFLRYDPALERDSSHRSFSVLRRWKRVHCKQADAYEHEPGKRHLGVRLAHSRRRACYAREGGVSASSFRRLSPQDSIEEEHQLYEPLGNMTGGVARN